jgi:hypothetical protein
MPNPIMQEKRKEERVSVKHIVSAKNSRGVTRDISASGVFFELDALFVLGDVVDFVIEFGRQGVNFVLKCIGEVVRLENRDGRVGVAVKISRSVMEAA